MVLPYDPAAVTDSVALLFPCTYTPQDDGTSPFTRVALNSAMIGLTLDGTVTVKDLLALPMSVLPLTVYRVTVAVPDVALGIVFIQLFGMVNEEEVVPAAILTVEVYDPIFHTARCEYVDDAGVMVMEMADPAATEDEPREKELALGV